MAEPRKFGPRAAKDVKPGGSRAEFLEEAKGRKGSRVGRDR